MIVAGFSGPDSLQHAARTLRHAGVQVETRTPVALPDDEDGASRIPLLVLAAGMLGAVGAFGLQCYGAMVSYPLLIGGRPQFFWTSYIVFAFESGAFLIANRLPRLYEPSDEVDALRAATRDGWFLLARGQDAAALRIARDCGAIHVERAGA
jgi:hypothetical protein